METFGSSYTVYVTLDWYYSIRSNWYAERKEREGRIVWVIYFCFIYFHSITNYIPFVELSMNSLILLLSQIVAALSLLTYIVYDIILWKKIQEANTDESLCDPSIILETDTARYYIWRNIASNKQTIVIVAIATLALSTILCLMGIFKSLKNDPNMKDIISYATVVIVGCITIPVISNLVFTKLKSGVNSYTDAILKAELAIWGNGKISSFDSLDPYLRECIINGYMAEANIKYEEAIVRVKSLITPKADDQDILNGMKNGTLAIMYLPIYSKEFKQWVNANAHAEVTVTGYFNVLKSSLASLYPYTVYPSYSSDSTSVTTTMFSIVHMILFISLAGLCGILLSTDVMPYFKYSEVGNIMKAISPDKYIATAVSILVIVAILYQFTR